MTPEPDTARGPGRPDAGLVDADNPWPGLASFREADRALLPGPRTRPRRSPASSLRRAPHGPLRPLGPRQDVAPGRAGAVPPPARRGDSCRSRCASSWRPRRPLPGDQVREAIARQAEAAGVEAPAARAGETLWEYFHRPASEFWSERNRLVIPLLVFDQFEEVFTLGAAARARRRRGLPRRAGGPGRGAAAGGAPGAARRGAGGGRRIRLQPPSLQGPPHPAGGLPARARGPAAPHAGARPQPPAPPAHDGEPGAGGGRRSGRPPDRGREWPERSSALSAGRGGERRGCRSPRTPAALRDLPSG